MMRLALTAIALYKIDRIHPCSPDDVVAKKRGATWIRSEATGAGLNPYEGLSAIVLLECWGPCETYQSAL